MIHSNGEEVDMRPGCMPNEADNGEACAPMSVSVFQRILDVQMMMLDEDDARTLDGGIPIDSSVMMHESDE